MGVSDYSYLTFHGDYSQQGGSSEAFAGMLYSIRLDDPEDPKHIISGGAFIRWKDALIPVVKFDIKPLAFDFNYGVNISALKTASQGRDGMEFSLSYLNFLIEIILREKQFAAHVFKCKILLRGSANCRFALSYLRKKN